MRAADFLEEMAKLLRLNDENPFKVRAFDRAVASIAGIDDADLTRRAREGKLTEIDGIGKGIAEALTQLLVKGQTTALDELRANLPEGLLALTEVPGLGPKKARLLIDELGIRSLSELEYACKENRLLLAKGFGEKLQQKVLEGVLFLRANSGKLLLPEALEWEGKARAILNKQAGKAFSRFEITGALRRRLEIIDRLDVVIESAKAPDLDQLSALLKDCPLVVHWHVVKAAAEFWPAVLATTATDAHLGALPKARTEGGASEEELYRARGLPWIDPVLRETGEEVALAQAGKLGSVVAREQLKGVFHLHTTRSDGVDTLEDMLLAAAKRGYAYVGVSDHSQSAFYAQGLKTDALKAQAAEIAEFRAKHPKLRVFWGIESDILQDGALDYDQKTLGKFDFVIASVHSRFQMDRGTMTERLIQAVRQPATRMLGHLTGRLLLGRPGYAIDTEAVVAECAKQDVAIELNCHPSRLDIDWRFGPLLRKTGCKVSINPDAHEVAGYDDVEWGVIAARKALLPPELVVNTWETEKVAKWLARE